MSLYVYELMNLTKILSMHVHTELCLTTSVCWGLGHSQLGMSLEKSGVFTWLSNSLANKRNVLEPHKHNNDYALPVCKNAINTEVCRIQAFMMSISIKATRYITGPYILFWTRALHTMQIIKPTRNPMMPHLRLTGESFFKLLINKWFVGWPSKA